MKDLSIFKQFSKGEKKEAFRQDRKAVIYTRVSTKEQAETNKSLDTQKKYCEIYAERKDYEIVEYFGGTYESAKSDERKEFQRMLAFVKKKKDISCIIVYSYDRFSRTGANGAYISDQLKKMGVVTLSATQEVEPSTSAGSFQQNLYYMFSQFDNELRRDKSVSGMKEKLRRGYWMGGTPLGYTNINPGEGKEQRLVINKKGEFLKLAFKLKLKYNLSNTDIAERLRNKGCEINRKKFSEIFRNPFYCGIIISPMLPDEVIEGIHPAIITKQEFLKINNLIKNSKEGKRKEKVNENLPLKQFVKSASNQTYYTGYLKRKKESIFYYYKNNQKGVRENINAGILHEKFKDYLTKFQIKNENFIEPFSYVMKTVFVEAHQEEINESEVSQKKVVEFQNKLERLEERFVFEEITKEQYNKFKAKLSQEKYEIEKKILKDEFNLSNLENSIQLGLQYSVELPSLWAFGDYETKRSIQDMIFPEGILYDFQKGNYRTDRLNVIFDVIASLSEICDVKNKGTKLNISDLSHKVVSTGIEPAHFKKRHFQCLVR